jgi:hypothetical protein
MTTTSNNFFGLFFSIFQGRNFIQFQSINSHCSLMTFLSFDRRPLVIMVCPEVISKNNSRMINKIMMTKKAHLVSLNTKNNCIDKQSTCNSTTTT